MPLKMCIRDREEAGYFDAETAYLQVSEKEIQRRVEEALELDLLLRHLGDPQAEGHVLKDVHIDVYKRQERGNTIRRKTCRSLAPRS